MVTDEEAGPSSGVKRTYSEEDTSGDDARVRRPAGEPAETLQESFARMSLDGESPPFSGQYSLKLGTAAEQRVVDGLEAFRIRRPDLDVHIRPSIEYCAVLTGKMYRSDVDVLIFTNKGMFVMEVKSVNRNQMGKHGARQACQHDYVVVEEMVERLLDAQNVMKTTQSEAIKAGLTRAGVEKGFIPLLVVPHANPDPSRPYHGLSSNLVYTGEVDEHFDQVIIIIIIIIVDMID